MAATSELLSGFSILLLEDDSALNRRLAAHLESLGGDVAAADSIAGARRLLAQLTFDFALVDLQLPDGEALELLRESAFSENTGVVVMTAFGGVRKAVEAMRLGAGDYLSKPFEVEEVPLALLRSREKRGEARREQHRASDRSGGSWEEVYFGENLSGIRARLDAVLAVERRLERQLPPVLLEGETGTGKSIIARWLHREGPRRDRPFVPVNCAALPDTLAESELFGHERGAFTDARQARLGLFEAADGGTLFLDEIATLAPATQAKLLTAVENGTIRRVGANREVAVDVRLIAATNRPLTELVESGEFRADLFQRLNLVHLVLPPLREAPGDIVPLARHLLAHIARRHRVRGLAFSPAGEARLAAQPWRGNARELAHEIEREVIFARAPLLEFAHLGAPDGHTPAGWRNPAWRLPLEGFSLEDVVGQLVDDALRETNHNVSAAARRLGVTREFLRYRLAGGKGN